MRSLELKPIHENLINTYIKDSIGRNKDIALFAQILNSINDSCSVAIDGAWGSGKTFFVKQVKMFLDAHNPNTCHLNEDDKDIFFNRSRPNEFAPQVTVYYDAWENDNDEDPVLSLVYSIMKEISVDYDLKEEKGFAQKAASVLELFTGRNWSNIIESFRTEDPLDKLKKDKNVEEIVAEFLESLLVEKGNRLIVFIDELDRCNPSYATKLLERIKHYFSNDRITFVFSVNISELQHTIKKHYGEKFDACRYLDRFFDLRISLPPADLSKFYRSIDFNDSYYTIDSLCGTIIKNYKFSLREIAKYIRLINMAIYSPTHNSGGHDFSFPDGRAKYLCIGYIVPIMIALNVFKRDLYEDFISGNNPKPLYEILSNYRDHFNGLLDRDESFEAEENKTIVTLEQKLEKVYHALFIATYTSDIHRIKIGEYTFDESTKKTLMKVASALSEYTLIKSDDE